jgi:hypothetical protein
MNRRHWLLLGLASALGATGSARAATPEGPWRTMKDGTDDRLMLEGHDAVAYFTDNAAVRGDPAIQLTWAGLTWRFASTANRDAFQKAPEQFAPQFGGFCSNGINYAIPWGGGGGPDSWRIYRGKLYVFGGRSARDHFEIETELNLQRAHQYWDDEVSGANALWQRTKRLIFRVPHYQSDQALQDRWEAMRAAGTLPVMPGAPQVVPR